MLRSFADRIRLSLCLLGLAAMLTTPSSTFAQAYLSQLTFLENFAIKLYERGDVVQAAKEFERILRIDPNSQTAKRYLAEIKAAKPQALTAQASSPTEKAASIARDIESLRRDVVSYEEDLKTLESLIRTLITENDHLYMTLNKRSREVMELRETLYKTPYGEQYKSVMADLPPDRVPQAPYRSGDISGDAATSLKRLDAAKAELEAISREIGAREQDALAPQTGRTSHQSSAQTSQPQQPAQEQVLSSQRDALVDKTLTLMEKKDNLAAVKNDLTTINSNLKTANNRYLELINKIDAYYRSVKAEVAANKYVEQKMFSDLMDDYTAKTQELEALKRASAQTSTSRNAVTTPSVPATSTSTPSLTPELQKLQAAQQKKLNDVMADYATRTRELENLKRTIAEKEAAVASRQQPLAAQDQKIKELDETIAVRDKQLADLKALLARQKTQLDQQSTVISHQKNELDYTNRSLIDIDTQLRSIQNLLADGQNNLDALSNDVKAANKNTSRPVSKPAAVQVTPDTEAKIRDFERQIARLEERLAEKDTSIAKLSAQSKTPDLSSTVAAKEAELKNLQTLNSQMEAEMMALKNAADKRKATENSLESRLHELETSLAAKTESLKAQSRDVQTLSASLSKFEREQERLNAETFGKNATINELKTRLSELENRLREKENRLSRREDDLLSLQEALSRKNEEAMAAQAKATEATLIAKTVESSSVAPSPIKAVTIAADLGLVDTNSDEIYDLLDQRDEQLMELNRYLTLKNEEIIRLRQAIDAMKAKAAEAEDLEGNKNALSQELEKISGKLNTETKARSVQAVEMNMLSSIVEEQKKHHDRAVVSSEKSLIAMRQELQGKELDLKEKELALEHLRSVVEEKTSALTASDAEIQKLTEKIAALENKQAAIKSVFEKRDLQFQKMEKDLSAARTELAAVVEDRKDYNVRLRQTLESLEKSNQRLAESEKLRLETENRITGLREDIKTAQRLLEGRDKDAASIAKLKDELCKRDAIITDLQNRVTKLSRFEAEERKEAEQKRLMAIIEKNRKPVPASSSPASSEQAKPEQASTCTNCAK